MGIPRLTLLALTLGVAATTSANAQSLRESRAREAAEAALTREAAFTETVCASRIAASIDWPSAATWPADADLVEACDGALGALEAVCRADKTRGAKVKAFVCAGDDTGPTLNGGVLRFGASPRENGFAKTKALLDARL